MGLEGSAARTYIGVWHTWNAQIDENFRRRFHPPDNPVNALLSFLNSLLYAACVSEIHRTGLYPGISFLHASSQRRVSLALDFAEPFKPAMVDRLLFRLLGQRRVTERSFQRNTNGVFLKEDERKTVVSAWDELMQTTVEQPQLGRAVSYRQLIRLSCYSLMKHLLSGTVFQAYRMRY